MNMKMKLWANYDVNLMEYDFVIYLFLCCYSISNHCSYVSIYFFSSFKLFLELEPQAREMLHAFYASKYGACLKILNDMKDTLLLDIYLAKHVNYLYTQIRNRALCQVSSDNK